MIEFTVEFADSRRKPVCILARTKQEAIEKAKQMFKAGFAIKKEIKT